MYHKIKAIVLGVVRHSDRVDIVSLYTDRFGRMSVVTPAGGSSRTARMRRASLMPLSVIETDINIHPERQLQQLGRFTSVRPNSGICGNPVKSAVAIFTAEFIGRALREQEPDPNLWQFLDTSIAVLDHSPAPANFHLAFMAQLTRLVGIVPDIADYTPDATFDMREGRYVDHTPPHSDILFGVEARFPVLLSKLNYANYHRWRLPAATRRAILTGMITYYAIHLPGVEKLNSLDILRQLFQ